MGYKLFWVNFSHAFAYFVISVYYPDGAFITILLEMVWVPLKCAVLSCFIPFPTNLTLKEETTKELVRNVNNQ